MQPSGLGSADISQERQGCGNPTTSSCHADIGGMTERVLGVLSVMSLVMVSYLRNISIYRTEARYSSVLEREIICLPCV